MECFSYKINQPSQEKRQTFKCLDLEQWKRVKHYGNNNEHYISIWLLEKNWARKKKGKKKSKVVYHFYFFFCSFFSRSCSTNFCNILLMLFTVKRVRIVNFFLHQIFCHLFLYHFFFCDGMAFELSHIHTFEFLDTLKRISFYSAFVQGTNTFWTFFFRLSLLCDFIFNNKRL